MNFNFDPEPTTMPDNLVNSLSCNLNVSRKCIRRYEKFILTNLRKQVFHIATDSSALDYYDFGNMKLKLPDLLSFQSNKFSRANINPNRFKKLKKIKLKTLPYLNPKSKEYINPNTNYMDI